MKFLITPDSYKGSMSAQEAAEVMESAIHKVLPEARCEILPWRTEEKERRTALECAKLEKLYSVWLRIL